MRAQLKLATKPWRREADAVTIALSFPPSLNNLFFNTGRGRAITDAYKAWRVESGLELMRQRPGLVSGRVEIALTFAEPTHQRRLDLDGLAKAVLDLCVEHGVIEGDDRRYVRKLTLEWGEPGMSGARVEIRRAG